MNLPFFIARRYLFARKSHNVINIISAISAAGMAIGTAALIIILSVYNGFDDLIRTSVSGIEPDILVTPAKGKVFVPRASWTDSLRQRAHVAAVFSVLQDNLFIDYDGNQGVALAKGVDSLYEHEAPLQEFMREGTFSLHKGELPQMAVGAALAYKLGVNPAFLTFAKLYFPDREKNISLANPTASLHSVRMRPSGIFSINQQIDESLVILPIASMRELLGYEEEVSALEVRLAPGTGKKATRRLIRSLQRELGPSFRVLDRFRQNTALYKMMRYEKAAIFLILLFVIIIIALNIFGSLTMLIIEKKDDIGTFRSLGATDRLIKRIFTLEGWLISLLGLGVGLVIGVLFVLLQQRFGFIRMPGVNFVVNAYPVRLQLTDLLLTVAGVATIGYLIARAPVRHNLREEQK